MSEVEPAFSQRYNNLVSSGSTGSGLSKRAFLVPSFQRFPVSPELVELLEPEKTAPTPIRRDLKR